MGTVGYNKSLIVAQDNRISQTARAESPCQSLTTYQKRLLLLLVAHIKKDDTELKVEEIPFSDYIAIMGLKNGGMQEKQIRESVLSLTSKTFLMDVAPGVSGVFSWIDSDCTDIDWNRKVVVTKLSEALKGYYIGLSKNFTEFQLSFTSGFKSKYSYRLFEYLKSFLSQGQITVSKDAAFKIFSDGKYNKVADFERRVLVRAVEEINEFSDIKVKYSKLQKSSKVTHFLFVIKRKPHMGTSCSAKTLSGINVQAKDRENQLEEVLRSHFMSSDEFNSSWITSNFLCASKGAARCDGGLKYTDEPGCYIILVFDKPVTDGNYSNYRDVYIGQSINMYQRVHGHFTGKGNGDVYADIKYGKCVYVHFIPCCEEELNCKEKELINLFGATESYNKRAGGGAIR